MNEKRKVNSSEPFLTIQELSERTGFSVAWLRKMKAKSNIPHYKFGNTLRFKESEFNEWAAQFQQQVG